MRCTLRRACRVATLFMGMSFAALLAGCERAADDPTGVPGTDARVERRGSVTVSGDDTLAEALTWRAPQLELVRQVLPEGVRAVFVTQAEALGLGHAVLCAKPIVGDRPFAVLLPDDLIWSRGDGALKQMADRAERTGGSVIAVQNVPRAQTGSYGIVATDDFDGRAGRITEIVEKPQPQDAPSDLAVVGRYILSADIFDVLESTGQGAGGEIQLTDAIAALLPSHVVEAFRFQGTRFDCGTHLGLIEATIRYALDHETLSEAASGMMRDALRELGVIELE